MQLHDDKCDGPQNDHEYVWNLIPWYVNGSLPDADIAVLEAHAETCAACTEEIGRQSVLAQEVVKADPFDVPLQRSWDTLHAQIEADLRSRTPARRKHGWLDAVQGRGRMMLGGLAVACLALVMVVQIGGPGQDGFVTLTSDPAWDAPAIRFQPAGNMTQAQLSALLEPLGVMTITGPSAAGIYTGVLAEDADPEAVSQAVMAQSQIIFAAPEAGQ